MTLPSRPDKETLTPDDFGKMIELLRLRPMQLAMLPRVLVRAEGMQQMMIEAIRVANQQA